jgi:uncharacterized protein (DUF302 family)
MTTPASPAFRSFKSPAYVLSLASSVDFLTTIARLEAAFASRHITLFAKVDQAQAAVEAGTSLRPTVLLLFGNPLAGTPVMQSNPHAAIELPLKAVVWQDETGNVQVDYLDVTQLLADGYGVDHAVFDKLKAIPDMLRNAIAG